MAEKQKPNKKSSKEKSPSRIRRAAGAATVALALLAGVGSDKSHEGQPKEIVVSKSSIPIDSSKRVSLPAEKPVGIELEKAQEIEQIRESLTAYINDMAVQVEGIGTVQSEEVTKGGLVRVVAIENPQEASKLTIDTRAEDGYTYEIGFEKSQTNADGSMSISEFRVTSESFKIRKATVSSDQQTTENATEYVLKEDGMIHILKSEITPDTSDDGGVGISAATYGETGAVEANRVTFKKTFEPIQTGIAGQLEEFNLQY